ncbi:glycosyltransferase [Flaviflexus huanghaiensis]|uniref:glycosyltransferase n=1 Tax=Flaviflexus huanghaiensis TaxID=1111473 RepID=UPI0015F88A4C
MAGPEIHVVTVAYNPGEELERMIVSLEDACPGLHYTVDIVDNGTETGIVNRVAADRGARIIRPGENLGYGTAADLALLNSDADWFLLVNPDTIFTPGAVTALVEATARWPEGGVFGPQLANMDGSIYPSARELPSVSTGVGHALFTTFWRNNPWTARYHGRTDVEHACGWLSGACLLMRREAFWHVGGFDPEYFMFFEDVDLGRRMTEAGWQSIYVPTATVIHDQGMSWRDKPAMMIRAHHDSAVRYIRQAYPGVKNAPLRGAIITGLKLRARWMTR